MSISKNGDYDIAVHKGRLLVLWDLKNKTSKVLSNDANLYSAYFFKGTNNFIWQDIKSDLVHVNNISGDEYKIFSPGFTSYGHVMSPDLKTCIGSDILWNLYKVKGTSQKIIKQSDGGPTLKGSGKLLNLTLTKNHLLSS